MNRFPEINKVYTLLPENDRNFTQEYVKVIGIVLRETGDLSEDEDWIITYVNLRVPDYRFTVNLVDFREIVG